MPTYEELMKALKTLAVNCNAHAFCDWCEFYDEDGETNCKLRNNEPALYDEMLEE